MAQPINTQNKTIEDLKNSLSKNLVEQINGQIVMIKKELFIKLSD